MTQIGLDWIDQSENFEYIYTVVFGLLTCEQALWGSLAAGRATLQVTSLLKMTQSL